MSKLVPDFWADSVYEIDYEALRREGVYFLFFDIDNTIALYSEPKPSAALFDLLRSLKERKFRLGLLSNGKSDRVARFASELDIAFVGGALKPARSGFRRLAEKLHAGRHSEIAIIGDQLYTDIKGGQRFGCRTVLVKPIDLADDPLFVRFKRIFERKYIKKIKRECENGGKTEKK